MQEKIPWVHAYMQVFHKHGIMARLGNPGPRTRGNTGKPHGQSSLLILKDPEKVGLGKGRHRGKMLGQQPPREKLHYMPGHVIVRQRRLTEEDQGCCYPRPSPQRVYFDMLTFHICTW
jgi:hypothetical protein